MSDTHEEHAKALDEVAGLYRANMDGAVVITRNGVRRGDDSDAASSLARKAFR